MWQCSRRRREGADENRDQESKLRRQGAHAGLKGVRGDENSVDDDVESKVFTVVSALAVPNSLR